MKNIAFMCLTLILGLSSKAQSYNDYLKGVAKTDTNFYSVKAAGEAYFAQDSILRDGNKYGYKEFLRWYQFWEARVHNEPGNIGNVKKYYELVGGYSQNRSAICSSSGLGYNWNFLGPKDLPDQYLGMITSVAYFDDGTNKTVYAGSAAGGIFKTTDLNANANWICITDDLNLPGIGFSDLRILDDPANNKRFLFAGTGLMHRGYGVGIIRLDLLNSSAVWEEVTGLPQQNGGVLQSNVNQIVLHPTDKNKLYALIGSKIYESINYGDNWIELLDGGGGGQFSKLIFHPADPNIMYISTYTTANPCTSPPVIWKSTDGGQNWWIMSASFNLPHSARIDIATSQILPNANDINQDPLYLALSEVLDCQANPVTTGETTEIFVYNNNITEFVPYTSISSQDIYITRHNFEISPNPLNINGNDPNMYFSSLGFHKINSGVFGSVYNDNLNMHVDIRDMEIIPDYDADNADNILIGNDGGVSLSTNNGDAWINMNGPGLNTTMFWGFDAAEYNSNIILGGTQDNEAYKYEISTDSWTRFSAGDNYKYQLSEEDGNTFFLSKFGVSGFETNKGNLGDLGNFSTFKAVPDNLSLDNGPQSLPQYQHPSGVVYFGQKEVGVLEPSCYNSRFISNIYQAEGLATTLRAIGVCENNPEVIYIGYDGPEFGNNPNPKKVFKTINASAPTPIWVDITSNIQTITPGIFDWIQISDIVVNPTNDQEVWISFENISYDFQGNGTLRVIHSTDGGTTWGDYSNNLPVVPVNDLEYLNGSVGGLYAATDVGIYFTEANSYTTDGWKCINENLPVLLVNDIEINYSRNKIIAGTFGRGIYESDLHIIPSYTPNTNYPFLCSTAVTTILNNTTISADQAFCGDIEIEPGVTLTVTGTVFMSPGTEIRVKNSTTSGIMGGRLIIDGGTITTREVCNLTNRWKGIFVMGDPTKSQIPVATTQQGVVRIINGGSVDNAQVGVSLGKIAGFSIINQGGVIITNNAFFNNNKRDVVIWPYTNFIGSPSFPVANKSNFYDTHFLTQTGSYIGNYTPTDNTEHLVLLGVDGVQIRKCEFRNASSFITSIYSDPINNPETIALDELGVGIYSVNSGFSVSGFCDFYSDAPGLPNVNSCSTENTFRNQFYAIKAISSNPLKKVFINGNHFNNNYHGIFLNGTDYSQITNNFFQIRDVLATTSLNVPISSSTPNGTDIPYAVHLNQTSNYQVSENYFSKSSSVIGSNFACNNENLKIALQVSLPDGNPEEIYNNYFTGYQSNKDIDPGVAVLVQGDINDTDPNNLSGLQILCNEFKGETPVTGVERYTNHIALVQNGKIDIFQGANVDETSPGGNTFGRDALQHDNCIIGEYDVCVDFNNTEGEYNTAGALMPGNITYYHHQNTTVFPLDVQCGSADVANSPTAFTYQKLTACPSTNPSPQPHLLRQNIKAYTTNSESELKLIDDNNTQGLLNLIYGNASPGQVKNALMGASPYLSDEVLMAYLYDSPPHGHLKEVVIANSPVTKDVKNVIDGMSLPNGIRNQINAAQIGVSERHNLEARVDWFELKKEQNINDLVRYHLQRDTVPDYLDSLKLVFSQYNVQHGDCKLAATYASQKDYIQALAIIDAHIAANPKDILCQLQKLMIEFDQQQAWCLNPTQDQKDKLEAIKDEPHKGCVAAKGFLELIEGLPLEDYRVLPQSNRSVMIKEEKEKLKEEENVQIYPNPTTNWITVNINTSEKQDYFVAVFDITGRRIISETLTKNTFDFDLSKYSSGLYSIQIRTEKEIIYTGKIVKE